VGDAGQGQEQGKTFLFTKRSLQPNKAQFQFHENEA
jgi:hypothetical protein